MSRTIIPQVALDLLRTMGDDDLESTAPEPSRTALRQVQHDGLRIEAKRAQPIAVTQELPEIVLDLDKLTEAQRLFASYQTEIAGALLLVALPQSYASEFGAGVLGANATLEDDLVRRIRRTAQFLVVVMQRATDDDDQRRLWDCTYEAPQRDTARRRVQPAEPAPWQWCAALRAYHHAVRTELCKRREQEQQGEKNGDDEDGGPVSTLLGQHNNPPLNQEDLLGMLLTFGITVFEVLERYGITWTADEQDAYLHAWDVIGAYLGIGTRSVRERLEYEYEEKCADPSGQHLPPGPIIGNQWHGLRPPTVDATRLLLEQIRDRQWIDPSPEGPFEIEGWTSVRAGRILTRALLDELQAAMPRSLELLPIAVMRALLPEVVRKRLNLGGNGLWFRTLALLPKRSLVTERFTMWNAPNRVGAETLRLLANDVTTRASVRFLQSDDYVLPGGGDWS